MSIRYICNGYFDRILRKNDAAAKELKKTTFTNLFNTRPAWLGHTHYAVNEVVVDAFGLGDDFRYILTNDEILARLFRLNQKRALP